MQIYSQLAAGVLCPVITLFLLALAWRTRQLRREVNRLVDLNDFWWNAATDAQKRLITIEWAYENLRERALVRNAKGQIMRASDEKQ